MRAYTNAVRWLGLLLLVVGFSATAQAQRTVSLWLNTATLPDTLNGLSLIEVRGAVDDDGDGTFDAPFTLPDSNVVDWSEASTLEPVNESEDGNSDYWHVEFQIPDNAEFNFKFFSQQLEDLVGGPGGWEDGGNNHVIPAGVGDTTLPLHYFNKTGSDQDYAWRPWEPEEGSVAVHFRAYMYTEASVPAGYDRESADLMVGLRGAPEGGGVLSWDSTNVFLAPEGDTDGLPTYHLFSGTAWYPDSAVGNTQLYKFFIEPGGWEGSIPDNRSFTVPANDTTLNFVFFDDTPPVLGGGPVTGDVIFTVDLSPLNEIGVFDQGRGDTLEVRGEMNGWSCDNPDLCLMQRVPGTVDFEAVIPITGIAGNELQYKYFVNFNDTSFTNAFGVAPPNGWEEPLPTTGANRRFTFQGTDLQDNGVQYFNGIQPANIIPDGVSIDVSWSVTMDSAITNQASPFVPGSDSVFVIVEDPIWAFTQGAVLNDTGDPELDRNFLLEDADGDGVYTGSYTVNGPTYAGLQYKYIYGQGATFTRESGGGFGDQGRRRTRYIAANADGSWPTEWAFEQEAYQQSGPLAFEDNPVATAVEPVDGSVPKSIWLGANYPNPFNPTTSIEYSIPNQQHVTVRVYDVTGRLISTLVDGIQPASVYRVTFEANNLASGVYFYQMETAGQRITKKMLLLK